MTNKGPLFDVLSFITLGIFMMLGGSDAPSTNQRLPEPLISEKIPEPALPAEKPAPTAPPDIPAEPKSVSPPDETATASENEWGPDPFQPPDWRPKGFKPESFKPEKQEKATPEFEDRLPDLTLTGILYQPDRQTAIINNRVMRLGDIIDNAEIIEIQKNRVIFQSRLSGNKKYMLKLGRPLQQISQAPIESGQTTPLQPEIKPIARQDEPKPVNVLETQETLEKTNQTLIQLTKEKAALSEQVNQLKQKLLTLQTEFEGQIKEKNNYLTQLKEVADKLIVFTGENADLKGQNVVLEHKLSALETTLKEEIQTKIDCLTQLQETRQKITSLEARLLQLNNDLSIERTQKNAYEQQVKELADKIPALTKEALTSKTEAQKATDETADYQRQIKDASDKISRLNDELITLRTRDNESTVKLAAAEKDLNRKINTLTDSLQETNREKLDYLNQLKLANDRLQAQTNELNRLSSQKDSLDKNKQLLESEIARLTEEKNRYFQSLDEANKKNDALTRTNAELDEKSKSSTREAKFYTEQSERTKEQITNLTNQVNELNKQISQVQQEKNNLAKQVQETTQKNIELASQLETSNTKLNTISAENNNLRQTGLSQQQTWQQKNDELISQVSQLTKDKINAAAQMAQLQNNLDGFSAEISTLRQKNASLEKDLKSLQEMLMLETGQKEKSTAVLTQAQEKLNELIQRENNQRTQIKELTEQTASLDTGLKELKQINEDLKKENSEKTAYLNEIQSVMEKNTELFKTEIDDLKIKNSALKESLQNLQLEIEWRAKEKSADYLKELAETKKTSAEQTNIIINLRWTLAELYRKANLPNEAVKEYQKYLELISTLSAPLPEPYPDRQTVEEIIKRLQQ